MKTRTPRRRPLAIACNQGRGFSLLEVSLALAAAAAIGTATFLVFRPSSTVAAVRVEQGNLRDLSQAVENSFGLVGTFASVNTARVSEDGLVPSAMLRAGSFRNSWGGSVEVAATEVFQPNDAFAIAYPSVPSDACVGLAGAVADSVWDLRVGGHSVFSAGSLDPAALASRCSGDGNANMVFIYHSGLASGTAVAAVSVPGPPPLVAPPTAPPSPPGTPVAPPGVTPVVVTPPVIVAPPGVTPPPGAPGYAPPPGTPGMTPPTAPPSGPPSSPPTSTATCNDRRAPTQSRTLACPASYYGAVVEGRTQFCPDYYGNPSTPTTYEPWASPQWHAWAQTSNTCTPCPGASSESQSQWVNASSVCPSGETGTIDWEKAQARTRSVSTSCPAPTWTLPSPTYGAWGAWSDTGATRNVVNSCTPATCSGPSTDTRQDPRTGGCPAGESGGTSWNAEQTTSRTCNAGTWSGWGAWTDTGNTSGYSSTCTPTAAPCVAPAPETEPRWTPTSAACPSGQTGTHTWEFAESRTRTAYCPATTGPFSWNAWGAWSATGATRNDVNTCAAPPPAATFEASCRLKGPGSLDYESKDGCTVRVRLMGDSGIVSARFMLDANPALYSIAWSGSCVGSGASCTNATLDVSAGRPSRDYDVTWTTTELATGATQTGTISGFYGEK